MCDFHASLDRALEPHDDLTVGRYFMPEPLENPSGIAPLNSDWQDLGYTDLTGFVSPQALISACIAKMADLSPYVYYQTNAYDPPPVDRSIVDAFEIDWHDPAPMTIEARRVNIETLEIAFDEQVLPLHSRPIPSRGTE